MSILASCCGDNCGKCVDCISAFPTVTKRVLYYPRRDECVLLTFSESGSSDETIYEPYDIQNDSPEFITEWEEYTVK